ncbi:MAG: GNAT family N-acetyltransferase [Gammaproteobacteria bacterium]|nr:GNAT family N-acetyltransferase [Gammaproteobacteria bacterium]
MDTDIFIDQANKEDCGKLFTLAHSASSKLLDSMGDEGRASLLYSLETGPRTWLENDSAWILCARAGAEILAYIALTKEGHLAHLFVSPAIQGYGLGHRLFQSALSSACPSVSRLTVNAALPSIGFYESLGFYPAGPKTLRNGISFLPMHYDCPVMA